MYLLYIGVNPPAYVKAVIEPLTSSDLSKLTPRDFYFNWKDFEDTDLWKLRLQDSNEILAAMSLTGFPSESRIEINLIASRRNNVGPEKQYDRVAGCLIGWACRLAVGKYGVDACVSLTPKTQLINYYKNKYSMLSAGTQLYVDGPTLYQLIQTYIDHEPGEDNP
ncbi:N-acetyltransferase [Telluribacter humicola]|uniref:N-acetyltransferase n=1 Tax=Telluribacter humicola TaxID=1720261 RepID=UPI001A9733FC|nr:N-acetyltransferase [Telluribacter humicola]